MKGISVLICSHNGEKRIKMTLDHLAGQIFTDSMPWEIVLVDNASTDELAKTACSYWKGDVPLRIIYEPCLGVTYARITGMNACNYSYICFVDDDNWVSHNYIETAYNAIDTKPDAGAVGGVSEAVFEVSPPEWFSKYQGNFAVGRQYKTEGKIRKPDGLLWGAGLIIRKEAWEKIFQFGYEPLLISRIGGGLKSGEESELLILFRMAGWSLYYDPNIMIQHYMPSQRLNWKYYLKLRRGLGASSIYINLYKKILTTLEKSEKNQNHPWWKELWKNFIEIIKDPIAIIASISGKFEGNYRIMRINFLVGSLIERIKLTQKLDNYYKILFERYIMVNYKSKIDRNRLLD